MYSSDIACFHSVLDMASWTLLGSAGVRDEEDVKTFFFKIPALDLVIMGWEVDFSTRTITISTGTIAIDSGDLVWFLFVTDWTTWSLEKDKFGDNCVLELAIEVGDASSWSRAYRIGELVEPSTLLGETVERALKVWLVLVDYEAEESGTIHPRDTCWIELSLLHLCSFETEKIREFLLIKNDMACQINSYRRV